MRGTTDPWLAWSSRESLWDEVRGELVSPEFVRATTLYREGEYSSAIGHFGEAIELDPQHAEAFYYRGLAYEASGNPQLAIADLTEAAALGLDPGLREDAEERVQRLSQ